MKIAIACDHAGFEAKSAIAAHLREKGFEVEDYGTFSTESCDYPDFAEKAGRAVACGECEKGVLICGTGVGISIAANKIKGVRCALCNDEKCAALSRMHNDANILAMGARIITVEDMKKIVDIFFSTDFEGGRHQRRVDKITALESK